MAEKTSVSFRVDSTVLKKLTDESEKNEVSLNTLANQVLKHYVNWYSKASDAGQITVFKPFLRNLLEQVDDTKIIEFAKKIAREESKDFILLLTNEYNAKSSLGLIETWLKITGYPYVYEKNNNQHRLFLQHDMGKKYSLYVSTLFSTMFDQFDIKKPQFDITEKGIAFLIELEV
jgi:hypothetical protein